MITITTPLEKETLNTLKAGDKVLISGVIYTARDAAHKRMLEELKEGKPLPFDVKDSIIYYAGPTPTPPGMACGSCGPTTSERMDAYAPTLIAMGLGGMIGKGGRNQEVVDAMKEHGAVYFAAIGGAGAIIAQSVTSLEVIAYEDLGTESVKRLVVKDFPAIVAIDRYGNTILGGR